MVKSVKGLTFDLSSKALIFFKADETSPSSYFTSFSRLSIYVDKSLIFA